MHKIILLAVAALIAGCSAAPVRTDVDKFILKDKGQIAQGKVPFFLDCLHDGFQKSHGMMTNFSIKQQRRATGHRVESYAGGHILIMSADVFYDGRAELYESSAAGLVNTSGEREAFAQCLAEHGVVKTGTPQLIENARPNQ